MKTKAQQVKYLSMKYLFSFLIIWIPALLLCSCKKSANNPLPSLVPELTTSGITNITSATASTGGNITADGGTAISARGVCWSTGATPTISDNKTTDGTGTGSFTSNLTGLSANTVYYVRAYATNSAGTAYGNMVSFSNQPVTDIDGNVYTTVNIGTQVWMAENLKTTRYQNGSAILLVTDNTAWINEGGGAYCNYENNSSTSTIHGKLYNWYAVNSANKLAPAGWHIPTKTEWETLKNYLIANGYNYDGTTSGNKIAKSLAASTLWLSSPTAGSAGNTDYPAYRNKSGFSAFPGGIRRSLNGTFTSLGSTTRWWTATEADASFAEYFSVDYFFGSSQENNLQKNNGFSVRCIKD